MDLKSTVLWVVLGLQSIPASAWGRRGHQVVGETAAQLVSHEAKSAFMQDHSYDFGYYCNVPDFIWKRPATFEAERPQHFVNLEIFEREFKKHPEIKKPLELSRADFNRQFPEIKEGAGRSFWRIREFYARLEGITKELRELQASKGPERQALQEKWFLIAGTLGHYVGDLAQPMHVSENYDGQLTDQKGIHKFFEDDCVDELYPQISESVLTEARRQWPKFKKENASKSLLELILTMADHSKAELKNLLAIDKRNQPREPRKGAKAYEKLIRARLVEGSLYLAELYRRNLGWTFDGDRFYFFAGAPEYITPGDGTSSASREEQKKSL